MTSFDFTLTDSDIELTRQFMIYTEEHGIKYFTSDDFRKAGLDRAFAHPETQIGTYFSKLAYNRVAVFVGELPSKVPSNNRRRNDLRYWDYARWRVLIKSRLVTV